MAEIGSEYQRVNVVLIVAFAGKDDITDDITKYIPMGYQWN